VRAPPRVGPPVASIDVLGLETTRPVSTPFLLFLQGPRSLLIPSPSHEMPPSRQERRKAERDAAKRAPRAGAAGAAAALANVDVNARGDLTTQAEDP